MIPENDTVKAERFSLFGLLLQKDFLFFLYALDLLSKSERISTWNQASDSSSALSLERR